MKKLLLFIVAAMFAAVTLPACSDDDEGNNNPPAQSGDSDSYASLIVGTWETIHYYSENNEGEVDSFDVEPGMMAWHVVTYKADKTFSSGDAYTNNFNGLYSIEGNKLTESYQGEITYYDVSTIKTLTATTLVLESSDSYEKTVYTYKRI